MVCSFAAFVPSPTVPIQQTILVMLLEEAQVGVATPYHELNSLLVAEEEAAVKTSNGRVVVKLLVFVAEAPVCTGLWSPCLGPRFDAGIADMFGSLAT